ncbi:30S ribosomal protein S6e [Methanocella arvoryzae]|uniref:Small ribosomal subunit protein eS6 n=1 Tax=Methanocella arvoryzae (strain DSM 22066 / NBRC 105507 / MRE50) TaxID=351160 RepID=RS6E_METAR|nr:30S ribosomal protein S6e [Methanocella arvoryzae]Q0W8B4.1 RecName: Full=Small ribosomal subunit protein eS6; AltName: Full=30S ribosomal protein S6e [Methanocella arvoryzae MRE50]CAJ35379.1 30S ribosomal protein S6E [Methanocella arvoryzae MRE50]
MADFKLVVSDPKTGKAYNVDVTGPRVNKFIGKPIGSEIDGETAGLPGYKLIITGGSDKDGIPMRGDIPGQVRRRVLVSGGIGYHPTENGMRRRKLLRGDEISAEIVQVNATVAAYGEKPLDELAPKKEKKEGAAGGRAPAKK